MKHVLTFGTGRHALLSRGWRKKDKHCIEPLRVKTLRPGLTTLLCANANFSVEVRILPLQQISNNLTDISPPAYPNLFIFAPLCKQDYKN